MSILLYTSVALKFDEAQLNVCWNNVHCKIFGFQNYVMLDNLLLVLVIGILVKKIVTVFKVSQLANVVICSTAAVCYDTKEFCNQMKMLDLHFVFCQPVFEIRLIYMIFSAVTRHSLNDQCSLLMALASFCVCPLAK
jgi:hypothetical protein